MTKAKTLPGLAVSRAPEKYVLLRRESHSLKPLRRKYKGRVPFPAVSSTSTASESRLPHDLPLVCGRSKQVSVASTREDEAVQRCETDNALPPFHVLCRSAGDIACESGRTIAKATRHDAL